MFNNLKKILLLNENSIEFFNSYMNNHEIDGYIYCLFTECFLFYGVNVYKIGKALNINNRERNYTTSYIDEPTILIKSILVKYYDIAEQIIFNKLRGYRIKQNREFFDKNNH